MSTGAVIARISSQYSDKGTKAAQRDIAKTAKKIDDFNKKIIKSYAIAAAAVAAFAVKLGKDAVQGAMEDEKQQTALAVALRNTAGATEAAIKANRDYLDSLELQVAIDNEKLIPALQTLVTATGNLAAGQQLLTLATDVSAASGKDLQAVSLAIAKAINGQTGSLNKLGLPLDQNAVKTKNITKLFKQLADLSKGQAAAAANTFGGSLERLRLKFNQVLDALGYALMPAIEEYANYIITDVVPNIEEWIKVNEEGLKQSFKGVLDTIDSIVKNTFALLQLIEKYKNLVLIIGAIPFLGYAYTQGKLLIGVYKGVMKAVNAVFSSKTLGSIRAFGGVILLAGKAFKTSGILVGFKELFRLLGMINPVLRGTIILFGAFKAGQAIYNKFFKEAEKVNDSLSAQAERSRSATRANRLSREEMKKKTKAEKEAAAAIKASAAAAAKAAAEQKRRSKIEADYEKINARIAKNHKVSLLSADEEKLVQLNAAEALLVKQSKINDIDKERIKALKEELLSLKVRNDLAERYVDILRVIADEKITDAEVKALALGWKLPEEAVRAYLIQFQAVADGTISDDEIVKLAKAWGSTEAQAAQYLDFVNYLNDGILSDAEIEKLRSKWKLTEEQVRMYADFVGIVNDGKLTDAEIVKIQNKWKLTTDQVVDYIKKIGSPVSYSGTLIDPARAAEIGWLNATAALQRYLDLLKAGTGVVVTPTTPTVPTIPTVPTVPQVPIVPPSHDPKIISDAAAAAEKVAEQIATLTELRKDTTPGTGINFLLKEHIDALKDNTSTFSNIPVVDERTKLQAMGVFDTPIPPTFDVAAFRKAEEKSMENFTAAASNIDYDERFRFNAFNSSGTLGTASGISGGNLMAAPVVNITVQGSVTSEQDLVQTVRNGLLSTQYNGNQLLLQAI